MTAHARAPRDATEIDLEGVWDNDRHIKYVGKATKQPDGTWRCWAIAGGALLLVEVIITEAA